MAAEEHGHRREDSGGTTKMEWGACFHLLRLWCQGADDLNRDSPGGSVKFRTDEAED